jgi:hypothetical protein
VRQYSRDDQRLMAIWSLGCAERVLPMFASVASDDSRPRIAIDVGRAWVATGSFSMKVIRDASLGAHAAAKAVRQHTAAAHAAHAAGQAVATAHVAQHAYGGAYYALRAVASTPHSDVLGRVCAELDWQTDQLPEHLREEISGRFTVRVDRSAVKVNLMKGPDF